MITKTLRTSTGPLGRGAMLALAINGLAIVLQLGLQILLARSLELPALGAYSYFLSCGAVLVLFGTFGLDSVLARFIPKYRVENSVGLLRGLIRWSYQLTLRSSVLVSSWVLIVTLLFGSTWPTELSGAFLVGAPVLIAWSFVNVRQSIMRGFKLVAGARLPDVVIRPILFGALLLLARQFGGTPLNAPSAMGLYLVAVFAALVIGVVCFPLKRVTEEAPVYTELLEWRKSATSLVLVATLISLSNELDKIVLGVVGELKEVAVYAIVARLAGFVFFGVDALYAIALPMLSESAVSGTKAELSKFVSKVAKGIVILTLPIFLAIILLGKPILGTFGPQFVEGYIPLVILSASYLIAALSGPGGFLLVTTGHHSPLIRVVAISIAIGAPALLILTIMFGSIGAAIGGGIILLIRNILYRRAAIELVGVDSAVWRRSV